MNMLELKNVHKQFGDNVVLKDVSLKVEKGDVVAILGPRKNNTSKMRWILKQSRQRTPCDRRQGI